MQWFPCPPKAYTLQEIKLIELKKIANLGAGAFGQVFLVKHAAHYYALKCLGKASVIEAGLQVSFCLAACHAKAAQTSARGFREWLGRWGWGLMAAVCAALCCSACTTWYQ